MMYNFMINKQRNYKVNIIIKYVNKRLPKTILT